MNELTLYNKACRALAAAVSVDEVMRIRVESVAIAAAAKIAKNRSLEADAVVLRLRATRRLDQLRQKQKETVGLARGGEYGGRRKKDGVRNTPSIVRPTLEMQGIDKNLAKQGRVLGALSDEKFEAVVSEPAPRSTARCATPCARSRSSQSARATAPVPSRAARSATWKRLLGRSSSA
jgi:hypothetical protein